MKTIIYAFECKEGVSEEALDTTIRANLGFIVPVVQIERRRDLEGMQRTFIGTEEEYKEMIRKLERGER